MDTIDRAFTTASMANEDFCLPVKLGLELGKRIINKYYNLTDESEIYRVSIGIPFKCFLYSFTVSDIFILVLHPGLRMWYFKTNKWPQEWQDEAVSITQRVFDDDYKDFGMADERTTLSANVAHIQSDPVSLINFFESY